MKKRIRQSLIISLIMLMAAWSSADSDPDHKRVSEQPVKFPLTVQWEYRPAQPPEPAFENSILKRTRLMHLATESATHDWAFEPVTGEGKVFFASSSEEAVFALDKKSGRELWHFWTNAPVRFAPFLYKGRLYFGSDDGNVYCLEAATGKLVWKKQIAPEAGVSIINGRPCSTHPVRGSVTIKNDILYCSAGIFPEQDLYVTALKPEDGSQIWQSKSLFAAHGQSLVLDDGLWIPSHRLAPVHYSLKDGTNREFKTYRGAPVLRAAGGTYTWTVDGLAAFGPNEAGRITLRLSPEPVPFKGRKKKAGLGGQPFEQLPPGIYTALPGYRAVADEGLFVLLLPEKVFALKTDDFRSIVAQRLKEILAQKDKDVRKIKDYEVPVGLDVGDKKTYEAMEAKAVWSVALKPEDEVRGILLTPEALLLGARGRVFALNRQDGSEVWTAGIDGTGWYITPDNDGVIVATTSGRIYAFGQSKGDLVEAPIGQALEKIGKFQEKGVKLALERVNREKGFCLVFGGTAGLAATLADASDLKIVMVEKDRASANQMREALRGIHYLGEQVYVREADDLKKWVGGIGNLVIVAEEASAFDRDVIMKQVQPYGGTLAVLAQSANPADWQGHELGAIEQTDGILLVRRGAPEVYGSWATGNVNAANTMSTGEATVKDGPYALQWFGRPYADDIGDRHDVPQAPLARDGIMLLSGRLNTLRGIDMYNGTILWKIQQPKSLRYLASHNSSPIVFGPDHQIFAVSGEQCWQLNAVTGEKLRDWNGTRENTDWGFVMATDGKLYGTSQGKDLTEIDDYVGNQVAPWPDKQFESKPAVSFDLFAQDITNGQRLWDWSKGLIMDTTITFGGGKMFLVASDNAKARAHKSGAMEITDFLARDDQGGPFIVALDPNTGDELWRRDIQPKFKHRWLVYLAWSDGTLLLTRTGYKEVDGKDYQGYDFTSIDDETGYDNWTNWVQAESDGHYTPLKYAKNSMSARPIIVGNRFFLFSDMLGSKIRNYATPYDLKTGKQTGETIYAGNHDKGCSVAIASEHAFYYRDFMHAALALDGKENYRLTGATRPSCWPNTLPVGGLILAPEGAASCSCGFPYMVSFALAPLK